MSVWSNSNTEFRTCFGFGSAQSQWTSSRSNPLRSGPFGSNSFLLKSNGPSSLPVHNSRSNNSNSSLFRFDLKNQSGSGPTSLLTFGTDSKPYDWNCKSGPSSKTSSGGSSRFSSGPGSSNSLDWNETVDEVFRQEIGLWTRNLNSKSRMQ